MEFGFDEALTTRLGLMIAHWGYRPVEGVQASLGPHQLPLFLYLAALPLKVWPSPLALVYFVGFLNALAVPLAYWMGRRYWGNWAGSVAGLLFAVNAWSVAYARKVWTQNITLFTVLFFLALFLTFVERRPWALVGAWVGLAALIGLHLEGIAFLFVLLPAMLVWRDQVKRTPLAVGVLAFAVLLSPYLLRDAQQGWSNVRRFLAAGREPAAFTLDAVDFAFRLGSGRALFALAGEMAPMYRASLPPLWGLTYLMEGVLAVACGYAAIRVMRSRGRQRRAYALLLLWFWVPVGLQLYHTRPVFPHYFLILYPAPFLLVGALVERLMRPWQGRGLGHTRVLRAGVLAFVVLWAGWQVLAFQRLLGFVDRYPTPGGFGTPLKYYMLAADAARAAAQGEEIVVMAPDGQQEWSPYRQIFDALLFTHPRRFINGQNTVVMSTAPAVYLVGPMAPVNDEMEPTTRLLVAFLPVRIVDTVRLPDNRGFLIARAEGARAALPSTFSPLSPPVTLDNGAALAAYRVEADSGGAAVWLAWARERASARVYHVFVHAVDAEGEVVSTGDVSDLLPYFQREGEWVFTYVRLPLARNAVRVEVGMYTWPDMARARVLTSCSQCLADRVVLPLSDIQ